MGTRKRAGKGRHDKKGKGKKHHKKQTRYDDWEPTSSGQESDTPSEPDKTEIQQPSRRHGQQPRRADSNSDKTSEKAKATGGKPWFSCFIVVLLCVVVLSATPFLIQYYKQSGSDFVSIFKSSSGEESMADFNQELSESESFTQKQESSDSENDAACLKSGKETGQNIHIMNANNRTDPEMPEYTGINKPDLDTSTATDDPGHPRGELKMASARLMGSEENVVLESSLLQAEGQSLPDVMANTGSGQDADKTEIDQQVKVPVILEEDGRVSNAGDPNKPDHAESTVKEESHNEQRTEVADESLQTSDSSRDLPLQADESKSRVPEEGDEPPVKPMKEESVGGTSKLESSANVDSHVEEMLLPAESTKQELVEPHYTGEQQEKEPDTGKQTDSVASEQKTSAVLTDNKHDGDGVLRDSVDNISVDDADHSTHTTPTPVRPKKVYAKANITNSADNKIREELDEADSLLEKNNVNEAQAKYRTILARHPKSPRANYGLAQTLCKQAEQQLSNKLLEECIEQYQKMLNLPNVPRVLMLKAGRICAERQQFRGWGYKAVKQLKRLIELYPDETELLNELGVQYLMVGRNNEAKTVFTEMLRHEPDNAFAKAHMGFIYKTSDNNIEKAVPMLMDALSSGDPSVQDGRFYFHLGDALQRLGNKSEAYVWYEKGAERGFFKSKYQRSLYNVEHLTARPWWTKEQTGQLQLIQALEENWEMIRDEGLANIDKTGAFLPENENLRETGDWKQFTLFQQGRKNEANCRRTPKTCALIERFPAAATCKRGQVKYSIMQPGVHVWPHCGPTNCRIRMHLGLVVPKGCCRIRVVDDTRTWEEGKVLVFDDSFEHEVWHEGSKLRLVLIVDIWHPELTSRHKAQLSPI